jgi:hypothetical protein
VDDDSEEKMLAAAIAASLLPDNVGGNGMSAGGVGTSVAAAPFGVGGFGASIPAAPTDVPFGGGYPHQGQQGRHAGGGGGGGGGVGGGGATGASGLELEMDDVGDGTYTGTFTVPMQSTAGRRTNAAGTVDPEDHLTTFGGFVGFDEAIRRSLEDELLGGSSVGALPNQWQLAIQVGGIHVAGSPFAIEVINGRRFTFDHIVQGDQGKASSFDGKGVLYYIGTESGTKPYTNPHRAHHLNGLDHAMRRSANPMRRLHKGQQPPPACNYLGVVVATSTPTKASSKKLGRDTLHMFVEHIHDGTTPSCTPNTPNSWISVDLGW